MITEPTKILSLIHLAEKMKNEFRHSWMENNRQESIAEHSWRLSLMAVLLAPELDVKIDLEKALKIAIIHDLVEAITKDIPAFEEHRKEEKEINEKNAITEIQKMLSSKTGDEIKTLWYEFEKQLTPEAKFVRALDKLETRIQHNEDDIATWSEIELPRCLYVADEHCEYDGSLKSINELVKDESREKLRKANLNIEEIEAKANELRK